MSEVNQLSCWLLLSPKFFFVIRCCNTSLDSGSQIFIYLLKQSACSMRQWNIFYLRCSVWWQDSLELAHQIIFHNINIKALLEKTVIQDRGRRASEFSKKLKICICSLCIDRYVQICIYRHMWSRDCFLQLNPQPWNQTLTMLINMVTDVF